MTDVPIKLLLTLEDKLSGKAKEASASLERMGDAVEQADQNFGELTKEGELLLNMTDSLSDDFKKLNPQLFQAGDAANKAGGAVEKLANDEKKAEKATGNLNKQIGQFAKGLLGVATLYAAGRFLVDFAKDSVKAAEAAGAQSKALDSLRGSYERIKVAVGTIIVATADGASSLGKFSDRAADALENAATLRRGLADGTITFKEYTKALWDQVYGQKGLSEATLETIGKVEDLTVAEVDVAKAAEGADHALMLLAGTTDDWTLAAENAKKAAKEWQERIKRLAAEQENLLGKLRAMRDQKWGISFDANSISSAAQNLQSELEFAMAGGLHLGPLVDEIRRQLAAGGDFGIAQKMLQEIDAAAVAISIKLGDIDMSSAARNFADAWGISIDEAKTYLQSFIDGVNDVSLEEIRQQFGNLEEAAGAAYLTIEKVKKMLKAIDGMSVSADIIINTVGGGVGGVTVPTGTTGTVRGDRGVGTGPKVGLQAGGSFVVPPGYPGDTFSASFSSGEVVRTSNKAQSYADQMQAAFMASEMADKIGQAMANRLISLGALG